MYISVEFVIRLVASVLCGGLIGFERGESKHEAGLRTHILVCLGAALIMVVSEAVVDKYKIDAEIMRMGAQIVSGIGFLGAGSIIVDGNRIRGITTAAGIWTTACVGIAVGAGFYVIGIFVVVLMLFIMHALKPFIRKIRNKETRCSMSVKIPDDGLKDLLSVFSHNDIELKNIKVTQENDTKLVDISIASYQSIDIDRLMCEIGAKVNIKEMIIN